MHAEEDAARKEEVEVRNNCDALVNATEQTLAEVGDKAPADVKSAGRRGHQRGQERARGLRPRRHQGRDREAAAGGLQAGRSRVLHAKAPTAGAAGCGGRDHSGRRHHRSRLRGRRRRTTPRKGSNHHGQARDTDRAPGRFRAPHEHHTRGPRGWPPADSPLLGTWRQRPCRSRPPRAGCGLRRRARRRRLCGRGGGGRGHRAEPTSTSTPTRLPLPAAEALKKAQADAAEWQDKFVRLHAEWDTYRRRTAEQREAEKSRAAEKLVYQPAARDRRLRAHHRLRHEKRRGRACSDGVEAPCMPSCSACCRRTAYRSSTRKGQAFDALEAQAVATVDDASVPDETVAEVYQKGYQFGNEGAAPRHGDGDHGRPQARKARGSGVSVAGRDECAQQRSAAQAGQGLHGLPSRRLGARRTRWESAATSFVAGYHN